MKVPTKLAVYAVALVAAFALGLGVGGLAGPLGDGPEEHVPSSTVTTSGMSRPHGDVR